MAADKESASLLAGSEPAFDIVCVPCDTVGKHLKAKGYCMDCCEHLCVQCLKYHRTLSALKKHKLVDEDNMPLDQKASLGKGICTEACYIHKNRVIEYLCQTHQVLGCSVCITLQHKQCKDVAYIPEVSADFEHSQEYKIFKQQLDQLIKKSEVMFNSAKQNLKTSAGFYSRVQRDVRIFRQEINTTLDKIETDVKNKLEQINTECTDELHTLSRLTSRMNVKLQAISANFRELIRKKQNSEMFRQMKYTESGLSKLQYILKQMEDTNLQVCKFSPNEKLLKMLKANAFGSVKNTTSDKLRMGCVGYIKGNFSTRNTGCISSVAMVSTERLVVTDYQNKIVKLINLTNNKLISELYLGAFPLTLTTISTTKVAVTQPAAEKILLLTCDDKLVIDGEFGVHDLCQGIAYYQSKLIVTYNMPGKLEILSMTGEVLQRYEKDDQGKQLLFSPKYVSVDKEAPAMFVSDWGNDSLTKLSMDGKILAQYKDADLSGPGQCAIDQAGLVYLCGVYSHNIHLLITYCIKLKIILTQSDGLLDPRAITYCETTEKLYVGMRTNDRIKVYQLQY